MIALRKTSRKDMSKLNTLFASRRRSRVMSLKKKLSQSTQGTKAVAEILQHTKGGAYELALAN